MEDKGKDKEEQTLNGEPSAKRAKLDLPVSGQADAPATPASALPFESPKEEVLDDRLCLLSHEQLELLVTRLARTEPTLKRRLSDKSKGWNIP